MENYSVGKRLFFLLSKLGLKYLLLYFSVQNIVYAVAQVTQLHATNQQIKQTNSAAQLIFTSDLG